MAIDVVRTATLAQLANQTSRTFSSFEVSAGDNRMLVVLVALSPGRDVSSVAFGTQSFTQLWNRAPRASDNECWILKNPDVATRDIVVTFDASCAMSVLAAVYLTGVEQVTSTRTVGTADDFGTSGSVSATSAVGDLVIGLLTGSATWVGAEGQTEIYGSGDHWSARKAGADTSTTLSWTRSENAHWNAAAAAFIPSAEAAATNVVLNII